MPKLYRCVIATIRLTEKSPNRSLQSKYMEQTPSPSFTSTVFPNFVADTMQSNQAKHNQRLYWTTLLSHRLEASLPAHRPRDTLPVRRCRTTLPTCLLATTLFFYQFGTIVFTLWFGATFRNQLFGTILSAHEFVASLPTHLFYRASKNMARWNTASKVFPQYHEAHPELPLYAPAFFQWCERDNYYGCSKNLAPTKTCRVIPATATAHTALCELILKVTSETPNESWSILPRSNCRF